MNQACLCLQNMNVWSLTDCLGGLKVSLGLGDQVVIDGRSSMVCLWSGDSLMLKKTQSTKSTENLHSSHMHAVTRDSDIAGIQGLFLGLFQY